MGIRLIHIAPELPPTVGGVADYTAILSRRLVEVSGGAVEPVLVHAGKQQVDAIEVDFPVEDLSGQCSAAVLAEAVQQLAVEAEGQSVVLLEYSGYGYAKRGAPLWLALGLRRACWGSGPSLVTMFHELYATSRRPWESAFWTTPIQWAVTTSIVQLSDGLMTNRLDAAQWLIQQGGDRPLRTSPTFSNVGEPENTLDYENRDPYAVLFGGTGMKRKVYQALRNIELTLSRVGVQRLVDIGPEVPDWSEISHPFPVDQVGILPVQEVSGLLCRASVGLLQHSLHCLPKSGIWASYASHGVPPVVLGEGKPLEGLHKGEHYIRFDAMNHNRAPSIHQWASIAEKTWEWYMENAHSRHAARRLVEILHSISRSSESLQN